MKHYRYGLFIFLGILVQQLAHHLIERWYIGLLISDFEKYSLGLTWDNWFTVHHVGSFVFLALGIWLGYFMAKNIKH